MDALNSSNEKQQADAKYAVLIRGNTDASGANNTENSWDKLKL